MAQRLTTVTTEISERELYEKVLSYLHRPCITNVAGVGHADNLKGELRYEISIDCIIVGLERDGYLTTNDVVCNLLLRHFQFFASKGIGVNAGTYKRDAGEQSSTYLNITLTLPIQTPHPEIE